MIEYSRKHAAYNSHQYKDVRKYYGNQTCVSSVAKYAFCFHDNKVYNNNYNTWKLIFHIVAYDIHVPIKFREISKRVHKCALSKNTNESYFLTHSIIQTCKELPYTLILNRQMNHASVNMLTEYYKSKSYSCKPESMSIHFLMERNYWIYTNKHTERYQEDSHMTLTALLLCGRSRFKPGSCSGAVCKRHKPLIQDLAK